MLAGLLALCLGWPGLPAWAADPGPGPVQRPAAEQTPCQTELAAINQSIRDYNARVAELKTLRTDIETLGRELDQEEASVDRSSAAAMDALNARIHRSNELITRHQQLSAAVRALGERNDGRTAQFRASCKQHPPPPSPGPSSPPLDPACTSAAGAGEVERQIQASFADMRADEKQRQDEVSRVAQARARSQAWSQEKQGKVWLQLMSSPKFMAFEREKQPYVAELMGLIAVRPEGEQAQCRLIQRVAAMLPAIKAINTRQYRYMAEEMAAMK
jgi:hypothetical protein